LVNRKTKAEGRITRRNKALIPILEPEEVDQIIRKSTNKRDQCLVALLYLTGRRIMEILSLKKSDFVLPENFKIVTFRCQNEKSWRTERKGTFSIERHGNYKMRKDGKIVHYKTKYYEEIQPSYSTEGPSGQLLSHYVIDYLQGLGDSDYLFAPSRLSSADHINQPRAYQILRSLDDRLWLHALRHINFSRMAVVYRDDPRAMHDLTFHRRFESTIGYIKNLEKGERLAKL